MLPHVRHLPLDCRMACDALRSRNSRLRLTDSSLRFQRIRENQVPARSQPSAPKVPLKILGRLGSPPLHALKDIIGHVEGLLETLQKPAGRRPKVGDIVPTKDRSEER